MECLNAGPAEAGWSTIEVTTTLPKTLLVTLLISAATYAGGLLEIAVRSLLLFYVGEVSCYSIAFEIFDCPYFLVEKDSPGWATATKGSHASAVPCSWPACLPPAAAAP